MGEAVEVAEGVLWLRAPLPMALNHVNLYALEDGDGWTLIDSGVNTPRCRRFLGEMLAGPLGGRPVRRLIVTHHHPDHIGLAGWLMAETGCELWTTRTAWLFARMLHLDHQDRPTPEQVAFRRACGFSEEEVAEYAESTPFNFSRSVAPMPLGFRRIVDGEEIEIGGRRWRVILGHGHAPDHATLYCLDAPIWLTGDQIIPGISSNIGVYPTEPEADPLADWLESCEALKAHARDDILALPGHKEPFHGVPFRLEQLIDNHVGALHRLRAHLGEPRTAVECLPTLFKREVRGDEFGLAAAEAVAHLNHLRARGEVARETDAGGVWRWRRL
jgi:glyoxylase-like metal-dependent hydrolase (beta-lactamase superfamily II)